MAEQAGNRRNNRRITADGETLTAADWSRRTGVHVQTILWRLRNGRSAEDAVAQGRGARATYPDRAGDGTFTRTHPEGNRKT
jgi:hypothetical protein